MAGDISRVMKQRILRRVDDLGLQVFTAAEIYTWLSEAQRDIIVRMPDLSMPQLCTNATWGPSTSYTNLIVAATSAYDLPSDFLRERGLKYYDASEETTTWAERIPVRELKLQAEVLRQASGTKPYYWLWNNQINLEVGTVAATDYFTFYYVKYPADYDVTVSTSDAESLAEETSAISNTTDPTVPRTFFRAMEEFAVSRCREIRKQYDLAQWSMGQYEKLLAEIRARFIMPGDPADDLLSDGIMTRTDNS